jgi:hypothetical protein
MRKPDFFVTAVVGGWHILDAEMICVATFINTKHGTWAYKSFVEGVRYKNMSLFDLDRDIYVVGNVAQLAGDYL